MPENRDPWSDFGYMLTSGRRPEERAAEMALKMFKDQQDYMQRLELETIPKRAEATRKVQEANMVARMKFAQENLPVMQRLEMASAAKDAAEYAGATQYYMTLAAEVKGSEAHRRQVTEQLSEQAARAGAEVAMDTKANTLELIHMAGQIGRLPDSLQYGPGRDSFVTLAKAIDSSVDPSMFWETKTSTPTPQSGRPGMTPQEARGYNEAISSTDYASGLVTGLAEQVGLRTSKDYKPGAQTAKLYGTPAESAALRRAKTLGGERSSFGSAPPPVAPGSMDFSREVLGAAPTTRPAGPATPTALDQQRNVNKAMLGFMETLRPDLFKRDSMRAAIENLVMYAGDGAANPESAMSELGDKQATLLGGSFQLASRLLDAAARPDPGFLALVREQLAKSPDLDPAEQQKLQAYLSLASTTERMTPQGQQSFRNVASLAATRFSQMAALLTQPTNEGVRLKVLKDYSTQVHGSLIGMTVGLANEAEQERGEYSLALAAAHSAAGAAYNTIRSTGSAEAAQEYLSVVVGKNPKFSRQVQLSFLGQMQASLGTLKSMDPSLYASNVAGTPFELGNIDKAMQVLGTMDSPIDAIQKRGNAYAGIARTLSANPELVSDYVSQARDESGRYYIVDMIPDTGAYAGPPSPSRFVRVGTVAAMYGTDLEQTINTYSSLPESNPGAVINQWKGAAYGIAAQADPSVGPPAPVTNVPGLAPPAGESPGAIQQSLFDLQTKTANLNARVQTGTESRLAALLDQPSMTPAADRFTETSPFLREWPKGADPSYGSGGITGPGAVRYRSEQARKISAQYAAATAGKPDEPPPVMGPIQPTRASGLSRAQPGAPQQRPPTNVALSTPDVRPRRSLGFAQQALA